MKTMKAIAALFATMLLVSNYSFETMAQKSKDLKTVIIEASMECNSCKAKIEKNIAFEKGVKDLNVNLDTKRVTITYQNGKNSDEQLAKAIADLGYTVKIVKDNPSKDCDAKTNEKSKECDTKCTDTPKKGDKCNDK